MGWYVPNFVGQLRAGMSLSSLGGCGLVCPRLCWAVEGWYVPDFVGRLRACSRSSSQSSPSRAFSARGAGGALMTAGSAPLSPFPFFWGRLEGRELTRGALSP